MPIDFEKIFGNLPEFLRPIDLVDAGLYKSRSDLCWSMKRQTSPPFIRVSSHKILFPKRELTAWLKEKTLVDEVSDDKP